MRVVLAGCLTVIALAGCEATPAPGGGASVMVPGRAYDATHSQEGTTRMKFMPDGTISAWKGGAWVPAGQNWFRRGGLLCTHRQQDNAEHATCAKEWPTGNGGFDVVYEDAMAEFRPVKG